MIVRHGLYLQLSEGVERPVDDDDDGGGGGGGDHGEGVVIASNDVVLAIIRKEKKLKTPPHVWYIERYTYLYLITY